MHLDHLPAYLAASELGDPSLWMILQGQPEVCNYREREIRGQKSEVRGQKSEVSCQHFGKKRAQSASDG